MIQLTDLDGRTFFVRANSIICIVPSSEEGSTIWLSVERGGRIRVAENSDVIRTRILSAS